MPPPTTPLLQSTHPNSPSGGFLAQADHLQLLFATLLYSQRAAVRPDAVLKTCTPPWFTRGAQHDSDEQLKYLLDALETEGNKARDGNHRQNGHHIASYPLPETEEENARDGSHHKQNGHAMDLASYTMDEREGKAAAASQHQHSGTVEPMLLDTDPDHAPYPPESKVITVTDSPGSNPSNTTSGDHIPNDIRNSTHTSPAAAQGPSGLFSGTLVHEVMCHTCAGVGRREEVFTDLALALSGDSAPSSVADLMGEFLAPELMSGDDQYWCDACGAKRDAEKRQAIARAPVNLVLVLKRFAYDAKTKRVSKICTRVPLDLTLRVPWGVWLVLG